MFLQEIIIFKYAEYFRSPIIDQNSSFLVRAIPPSQYNTIHYVRNSDDNNNNNNNSKKKKKSCKYHEIGTSVKPRRTIEAKTILPMASCRSAASQNATPTRSNAVSLSKLTGSGLVGVGVGVGFVMSLSISGLVTITSGPSRTFKFSLATKGLSMDNKNPSRVKVQGSLPVDLRRFLSAFDKCCLLCSRSRGKPGDEGCWMADWNKTKKNRKWKKMVEKQTHKHCIQLMFDVAS